MLVYREHLDGDLSPYTCILDNCPCPQTLYRARTEWTQHMQTDHKLQTQYWICPVCMPPAGVEPASFDDRSLYVKHLKAEHRDQDDSVQPYIDQIVEMSTGFRLCTSCPLCPEPSESPAGSSRANTDNTNVDPAAVLSHIAEHLHSFSLYSLPSRVLAAKEREYLGLRPEDASYNDPEYPYFEDYSHGSMYRDSNDLLPSIHEKYADIFIEPAPSSILEGHNKPSSILMDYDEIENTESKLNGFLSLLY